MLRKPKLQFNHMIPSALQSWLWSLLIRRRSKLKNSSTKWQSPWRIIELKSKVILSLPTELIERSVLIIYSDSWITLHGHLCIPVSLPPFHSALWSAFGLPRLPSFSHSTSLCLPFLSPFCPRHNSRRRSLFMRVLSHSDTHYLNRHMTGCGCYEILIQRRITVLFLWNFSLYPIQRWFWWLSYSNHSFQLIGIQKCPSLGFGKKTSVFSSGTIHFDIELKTRSHSETYFLLLFDKACAFIAIDCVQNLPMSEIESPRCSGKIPKLSS